MISVVKAFLSVGLRASALCDTSPRHCHHKLTIAQEWVDLRIENLLEVCVVVVVGKEGQNEVCEDVGIGVGAVTSV